MKQPQGELSTCVVYHGSTGNIVHTHTVMALPGAAAPTTDELESEALQLARNHPALRQLPLRVLHVAPQHQINLRSARRVDLQRQSLV
ncbi:hypothetical protein [Duganella sp.]|uniref:hypothetical protein n=1 Tax=Duganella sp. TaxID=1904440 RepID=UPI0031D582AC